MATARSQQPTNHACRDRCQLLVADSSDEELLVQFSEGDEVTSEDAFRAMVARHGPMVMGVCRHALHHEHTPRMLFRRLS